jgi:hypothetical protein
MPSIKRQLSREATEKIRGWGFGKAGKPTSLYVKGKKGSIFKLKNI